MSVLQRLTEGVVSRDVRKEGEALLTKREQTGLLEGLNDGQQKQGTAVLLENQAKELLRHHQWQQATLKVSLQLLQSSAVFGGLIANDLASVQPRACHQVLSFP